MLFRSFLSNYQEQTDYMKFCRVCVCVLNMKKVKTSELIRTGMIVRYVEAYKLGLAFLETILLLLLPQFDR